MLETSKQSSENNLNAMCLGGFFRRMVEPFKRYSRFFSGYAVAYAVVERCTDQVPDFASFLQENKMNPRVRGLDLNQFLIKPVQRICKYPLLLRVRVYLSCPSYGLLTPSVFLLLRNCSRRLCPITLTSRNSPKLPRSLTRWSRS